MNRGPVPPSNAGRSNHPSQTSSGAVAPRSKSVIQRATAPPPPSRPAPPAFSARPPVIQRYQGELMKQVGPSCWIFVIEAVVDAYTPGSAGYDTSLLAAIINLYPRHDVGDTREKELATIEAYLQEVITVLDNMRTGGRRTLVSREEIEKIIIRVVRRKAGPDALPNIARFLQIFLPRDGQYSITSVKNAFARGAGLAGELKNLVKDDDDAEGAMTGARGKTYIGATDSDSDIAAAIEANMAKPAATVGVRQRLKPRSYPGNYHAPSNSYDLTGVPVTDITEGGYHAIMLVNVDRRARTVTYKDPNYGNARITITFAHIKKMAEFMANVNGLGLELQSFTGLERGQAQIPGILFKWGRVPVLHPVAVAAPPAAVAPAAPAPAVVAPVVVAPVPAPVVAPVVPAPAPAPNDGVTWGQVAMYGALVVAAVGTVVGGVAALLPKMSPGAPSPRPGARPPVQPPRLIGPPVYRPKPGN